MKDWSNHEMIVTISHLTPSKNITKEIYSINELHSCNTHCQLNHFNALTDDSHTNKE